MKFKADAETFRLVSEAWRIKFAWQFEPYSAIHSSLIEPLPHQIAAVYEKMLPRRPLRFILADDPGAGKTIMTGLLIKELIARVDLQRCLIVCPGSLVEQWQDELHDKFRLDFAILSDDNFSNLCIARLDMLARNVDLQKKLRGGDAWDLIVCDEAHKMSATVSGNKTRYTRRFRLGQFLSKITRHFLLLTATPHNGKQEDFRLFLSLLDADRFAGSKPIESLDVSNIMRRLVKEDLLTFDGKPLFPERIAYTVNYTLSPIETELYERVTAYVVDGFNRAERLAGDKKNSVGFAMTILQRRLASSPLAIYKSLERRTKRLQQIKLNDARNYLDAEDLDELEDFPNDTEDELAERVTSARTRLELRQEIQTLKQLTALAKKVFYSGEDKKWRELSELLQTNEHFARREKLIIFTEHRDTLDYLRQQISSLFGRNEVVVTIHGGLRRNERHKVEERFKRDDKALILIATDAAGEGINLQNAHLMINYDLPWNPNRLEQRFGRIHRIGQKNICYLWNLVAVDTREGQVFKRLLEKLETERQALGGKVFDILGKVSFDNKPLRDLLIEAVRHGNNSRRLDNVMNSTFDADKLQALLRERKLTGDTLSDVKTISRSIERAELHKLQPYCTEKFFLASFSKLGGQIFYRGGGRYEIIRSPKALPIYKSVCFSKSICADAELISIGHPLLNAVIDLTLERFGDVLKQGTIFIDDNAKNRRVLFYIQITIRDALSELCRRLHFIEVVEDGSICAVSSAPWLDYHAPDNVQRDKILSTLKPIDKLESLAIDYADKQFASPLLTRIRADKTAYLDKLQREVKSSMRSEIAYLDEQADKRADELAERLDSRLKEINLQRQITATTEIIGKALIVPPVAIESTTDNRPRIELIAMEAVMTIERALGNAPIDISGDKRGYDIESTATDGQSRFIEVKGRVADAITVTVSKNEILTAINCPDNFILAIVAVSEHAAHVVYIKTPFKNSPDLSAVSVNYDIARLRKQGKVILDRNIALGGD